MGSKIETIKVLGIGITIHRPTLKSSNMKGKITDIDRVGKTNSYDVQIEYIETYAKENSYKIKVFLRIKLDKKIDTDDEIAIKELEHQLILVDVTQPITPYTYANNDLGRLVYNTLEAFKNNKEISL